MNYDEKCQLLIIGDSTVGKTSMLTRYVEDKFSSQFLATAGIDFFTKDETLSGKKIRIKIWDTAGQERYKSLTNAFFRNAQGVILVYDVSKSDTFDNLKYWIQSIKTNIGEKSDIKNIIIGNKIDLNREVMKDEAENFAKQNDIPYFEASAKLSQGISDSIKYLAQEILKDKLVVNKDSIRINTIKPTSEKGCSC
jgi:small GTP-binding protein